jgi:hypothetical protein
MEKDLTLAVVAVLALVVAQCCWRCRRRCTWSWKTSALVGGYRWCAVAGVTHVTILVPRAEKTTNRWHLSIRECRPLVATTVKTGLRRIRRTLLILQRQIPDPAFFQDCSLNAIGPHTGVVPHYSTVLYWNVRSKTVLYNETRVRTSKSQTLRPMLPHRCHDDDLTVRHTSVEYYYMAIFIRQSQHQREGEGIWMNIGRSITCSNIALSIERTCNYHKLISFHVLQMLW